MEGSELVKFETPPRKSWIIGQWNIYTFSIYSHDIAYSVSVYPAAIRYALNGSLTISVSFEEIQKNCSTWKNSVELQFLDLPTDTINRLPCALPKTEETPASFYKNCDVSISMDQTDLLCHSSLHFKIRPVYSTLEENITFRGAWLDQTIEPTRPQEWERSEALTGLIVNTDLGQQLIVLEWKSPLCLQGSANFQTNLSIVSENKYSSEYHVKISPQCSRLNNDLSKNSVVIKNGEITCSDGKKLSELKNNFKLTPCTNYSLTIAQVLTGTKETLSVHSSTIAFTTEFIPLGKRNRFSLFTKK